MTTVQTISTLIVGDEKEFCQSLRILLNLYNRSEGLKFQVLDEAHSLPRALKLIDKYQPSLLLLDLELNQDSGVTLLENLQKVESSVKILVLSAYQKDEYIFQTMQAGALGYVFKANIVDQLRDAVEAIINGKIYLPPEVAVIFFTYLRNHLSAQKTRNRKLELFEFTSREHEVLEQLVKGFSNEEIAQNLYITVATVKAHLTTIFTKLGVKNRTQAIVAVLKAERSLVDGD